MKNNDIIFDDFVDYELVTGTCRQSFPLHIHQSLCLGMITKGSVVLVCNERKTKLTAGMGYVIAPNTPHAFRLIGENTYSYLTFCFKNKVAQIGDLHTTIAQSICFIENADLSELTVDALCRFVSLSKFYFIRLFKKQVGLTPYQFILNKKMKKIRQGIVSQQSLSDLALEQGFFDQSHLCNTFKKHMGVSPLQFYLNRKVHYSNAGENLAKI